MVDKIFRGISPAAKKRMAGEVIYVIILALVLCGFLAGYFTGNKLTYEKHKDFLMEYIDYACDCGIPLRETEGQLSYTKWSHPSYNLSYYR